MKPLEILFVTGEKVGEKQHSSALFFMAKTTKVCQILLALWSGLRCLGVMTMSISHDHDVICPVAGKGKDLTLSGSAWPQSQQSQHTWIIPQQGGREDKRERGGRRREDRKKERSRALGSREQPAALWKALPSTCSPSLGVALGGVPWQHRTCQQQGNSTLTSAEGKKCFSPNQGTAGFSIKNTPKQLWVMPNTFNNRGNHSKWQLQNTKQTWKLMA